MNEAAAEQPAEAVFPEPQHVAAHGADEVLLAGVSFVQLPSVPLPRGIRLRRRPFEADVERGGEGGAAQPA